MYSCILCRRNTEWYEEWYQEVCEPCMNYFDELADSFKLEDNEDDDYIEIEKIII